MNCEIIPLIESLEMRKISDGEYFSEKYSGHISNSRLGLLNPEQGGSPMRFFEGRFDGQSDSLLLGSAVHVRVLQPESFEICDTVDRPGGKAGYMADELYPVMVGDPDKYAMIAAMNKASEKIGYFTGNFTPNRRAALFHKCEDYWKKRREHEKIPHDKEQVYLNPPLREKAYGCVAAVNGNPEFGALMAKGIHENEWAILLDVEVRFPGKEPFTLSLKSKLDNFTIDGDVITVNDLKTSGRGINEFNDNFARFHYSRELAMYSWLLSLVAGKFYDVERSRVRANCLVVSTIPPHDTAVYQVTKDDFRNGWDELTGLLRLAAYHYGNGFRFS